MIGFYFFGIGAKMSLWRRSCMAMIGSLILITATTTATNLSTISTGSLVWTVLMSGQTINMSGISSSWIVDQPIWNTGTSHVRSTFLKDPEYIETIKRLADRNIITTTIDNFRPDDFITRQESAKIFVQFYRHILYGTGIIGARNNCDFSDIVQTDYSLTDYIKHSCRLGILRWSQGRFMPEDHMSRLQMMVILTRMFENTILDESVSPWYRDYLLQAKAYNIMSPTDQSSLTHNVTRYELAVTLYRYYIKNQLIKYINTPHSRLKALVMLPHSISSDGSGHKTATIMTHMDQFDFNVWYRPVIDVFENSYAIRQTKTVNYPELKQSRSRYADLVQIGTDNKVGTIALVIFDHTIQFGTIRFDESSVYYTIKPYQAWYYTLTEIR